MLIDTNRAQFRVLGNANARRAGKRYSTVLLIGKVRQDAVDSACLVHDISQFGLMARFTSAPEVGETLCIDVRGLPDLRGTVRWVKGYKAGLEFDAPHDIDRIFCLKDDHGLVARTPRFAIHGTAMLWIGTASMTADLLDISPGGVKLQAETRVQRGQAGRIMLPDTTETIYGSVCWTREDRFGFRFVAPLPLATLSQILGC
jgi:hypothetical protein